MPLRRRDSSDAFIDIQFFFNGAQKFPITNVSFSMSVRLSPSVFPHWTAYLPLYKFLIQYLYWNFSEICLENLIFLNFWQEKRWLKEEIYDIFPTCHFWKGNFQGNPCKENQNTHFISSKFSPKIYSFMIECGKIWKGQSGGLWRNYLGIGTNKHTHTHTDTYTYTYTYTQYLIFCVSFGNNSFWSPKMIYGNTY
jgi:hypothetical protein